MWELARRRAKEVGVEFVLTVEDIRGVWPADGRCPVLGITLRSGTGTSQDSSPTLDRLIPAFGYTRDNIVVMSFRANAAKRNLTAAEPRKIAEWMERAGLS